MSTPYNNHMVNAIVRISGEKTSFVYLELEQEYGNHHRFTIHLDYDIAGKSFMSDPTDQIDYIGRLVTIEFRYGTNNKDTYFFKGVVTGIRMTGQAGRNGYLILEGSSPTIMLERGKRMDIYSNMTLYNISRKLIEGVYQDYMNFVNEPTYESKIAFLMQYHESDWEFLRRISYLYGENLFYNGSQILFGATGDSESVKLTYDRELSDLEFCSRMLPNQSLSYQYLSEQDTTIEKQSPDTIEGSNSYLDKAAEMNLALTTNKPAKNLLGATVSDKADMEEIVKREKSRTASQTVYVRGKSKSFKSTIGNLITVCLPEKFSGTTEMGTFRVTKSIHRIDDRLVYSNEFEAVPASLKTMPTEKPKMPVAESIVGTVTSNEDPNGQGRVQVDFDFSLQYSKVWMRVMTPSAGSGTAPANRGFVFIPEKGDQVMVGFEHGDPNRPYVMGSMFHGNNGAGGGAENHIKSIITKSGIKIVFNDNQKSLHIEDPSGSTWDMDGKGNIEVNAPKNITFVAKNMHMEVAEEMTINTGKNVRHTVGEDFSLSVTGTLSAGSDKNIDVAAVQDIGVSTEAGMNITAVKDIITTTEGDVVIESSDGEMQLASKGELFLKSDANVNNAK